MSRPHQQNRFDRGGRRRHRHGGGGEHGRGPGLTLTEEGFPAATPDVPRPSPVVAVAAESRARFPWLPPRVIAGSVWRGPQHERVRVDESGRAVPWRSAAAV